MEKVYDFQPSTLAHELNKANESQVELFIFSASAKIYFLLLNIGFVLKLIQEFIDLQVLACTYSRKTELINNA